MIVLGFLILDTILSAAGQGILAALLREYVPPTEQKKVNLALHYLLGWPGTLLTVGLLAYLDAAPLDRLVAWSLLVRVALFDPVLNATAGNPVFGVGQSALTDKLIQTVARKLRWNPSALSALVRVAALGTLVWLALSAG